MKYTQDQIDRSLKKLASRVAWANYPDRTGTKDQNQALWGVFRQAFVILQKTGTIHYYEDEISRLIRAESQAEDK